MTASTPVRHVVESLPQAAVAIELDNVAKAYKLYDRPLNFIKEALTGRPYHRDKHVLSDISLTIARGEIVGIIGRNGAGKSTLLKIIAGTLAPSIGTVSVDGRVSAILELGTGFNANYSGRDNVILSALMRGMSETAIRHKFNEIVSFAGLEDVIDEPFHTYSSGMQSRLAFAAAVAVEADVLIIDEALAAGDIRFAARSMRRIHEICQSGVTALFVSHVPYHVMQLCTRAIWLDDGRVRMDGPPIEVVRAYEYEMHEVIARDQRTVVAPAVSPGDEEATGIPPEGKPIPQPLPIRHPPPFQKVPDGSDAGDFATPSSATSGTELAPVVEPEVRIEHLVSASSAIDSVSELPASPEGVACARTDQPSAAPTVGGAAAGVFEPTSLQETTVKVSPEGDQDVLGGSISQATDGLGSELAVRSDRSNKPFVQSKQGRPKHFTDGQYRILEIAFLDRAGNRTNKFRFGDQFRLRIVYECLLPELPQYSCGLAVAFNRATDFEAVMYFNTSYPHSDDELGRYFDAPFRKYVGRQGMIEAVVDPLQLRAGEYHVSLGILPNQPGPHEFYEYCYCEHRVVVLANGFDEPSVFYPMVSWQHQGVEQ